MAIPKRVKQGGSYYKGSTLVVSSASGDYVAFLSISAGGCALNGISVIPSAAGTGDSMKLEHIVGTTGSDVIATLAETIPNLGAGIPINLDFYAQEKMAAGESLKLTYTNTASVAMDVFIILERGR